MGTKSVMADEILTIEETSQFLKVGKTTLYRLARRGKMPARKIGREWRFIRNELIRWTKEESLYNKKISNH